MTLKFEGLAEVRTVTNRIEKHGDEDDVPAVSIKLAQTLSNEELKQFHPMLLPCLYTKNDSDQAEMLEGIALTRYRFPIVDQLRLKIQKLKAKMFLSISAAEIRVDDAKLTKFLIEPKEGGSIVLLYTAGFTTEDVNTNLIDKALGGTISVSWSEFVEPQQALDLDEDEEEDAC